MSAAKLENLKRILEGYGSCVIAYSGGVDSVFLAKVAHDTLGDRSLAVIADSPSLPRLELEEALALGRRFGFRVRRIETNEFDNPNYLSNPLNRCYYCKQELFSHLVPLAKAEGFAVIAYGENSSDIGDFRPGAKAATEAMIRAPLKEAGLLKEEIRALSADAGLPTADKPQMACLSSRIPYGEEVSPSKLSMIERAEAVLRKLGFKEVRVRHHELGAATPSSARTSLARVEIGSSEFGRLLETSVSSEISRLLRHIGYSHVTLDLEGYRRGSLNGVLATPDQSILEPAQVN